MADGHGGARPGAGRPKNSDKFASQITEANETIADGLVGFVRNLRTLADGGFEQVSETYEPAGTVLIDTTEIVTGSQGAKKVLRGKAKAFPDLEPDELVLVKRTVSYAAPDANANQYLIDRLMGRPTQKHEFADLSDEEIIAATTAALGGDDATGLDSAADSHS